MFKRTQVCTGVLLAMGGLLVSAPAWSQGTERIEITGSRIRTLDTISNSPVSTVSAVELTSSAPVAVEEVVKTLPAAVPSIGPGTNNGSTGGAVIDLRGLGSGSVSGANRTLVLINGRRVVPFSLFAFVDTNSVPLNLVDRVEIVTGGASAVYGADAVAGVVNFILRKSFTGFEAGGSYGISEQGDAKRYTSNVTLGATLADGKGSVILSLGKSKTDPLLQGSRPSGQAALSSTTGNPQGSGTDVPAQISAAQLATLPGGLSTLQIDPATGGLVAPGPGFNFQPVNLYQTPNDRQQVTGIANYRINDHVEMYGEVLHTRSDVTLNLAGSGTFLNTFTIPIGNPFIPALMRSQLCTAFGIAAGNCVAGDPTPITLAIGRRITELGPRIRDLENKTTQWTLGAKGSIWESWGYDAYFSHGEADQVLVDRNWGSLSKVRQALNALTPAACVNPANGCVPLNVFGAEGTITPAMIAFFNLDSLQLQRVEQEVAAVFVNGDLGPLRSPFAKSPIGVAFGVERQEVVAGNKSDSARQIQSEVLGTGAPTPDRSGSILLKEGYAEITAPIVEGLPGVHALTFEGALRATSFTAASTSTYNTYKIGGNYSPIRGLKFRGMQQKATRAPSINELYAPQVSGLSNVAVDPCQGASINQAEANTPGTLSNLCRVTGVPVGSIGSLPAPSAGQINNLAGGNPALEPEDADTTTFGIVFEPDFAKGLTISLDYYNIEITKAISSASVTDILTNCYSAAANPAFAFNDFCALIFRNPLNGTFNGAEARGVFTASSNLGTIKTRGYDLAVNYRLPLRDVGLDPSWGRLDIGLNYNKVDKLEFQATPAAVNRNCNGFYSVACGNAFASPNFKEKWIQRTTWNVGDFSIGYAWRHLGKSTEEPGGTNFLAAFAEIPAYDYFDLNAAWQATKNVRLSLAVNNAGDKGPPIVGNTIGTTSANSGNTFPQTYDTVGRFYNFGVNVRF
ncbi:MAG: TonB-dependent receptor [Burkholderiales bacterium]|nr:TonB-dependent receptor [Burkholderiales bacterium]